MHNLTYTLENSKNASRSENGTLHVQSESFEEIATACHWRNTFNIQTEIETITPDDYERSYWFNGKPRAVIPMVHGEKHGIEHDTFANGALYTDLPWRHGKQHGTFTLYREDGTVEQKLSYKDGEPYGINQWFDEKGNLSQEWLYLSSKKILPVTMCKN
jgi:antitoxin component YwqK of YwqJK toxin-antitoxin module